MSLDQPTGFVKHQTPTRDAFLGGRLTVSQPARGFRAGLDSVLLGAAVGDSARRLLDLGAGVGTATLVALALGERREAVLVERDPAAAALARHNLAANGMDRRGKLIELDLTAPGSERRAAGLADNAFDAVIANPPFFPAGRGTLAGDVARADARHMALPDLDRWAKAAAGAAAGGAEVIVVYPAGNLLPLLGALEARFGAITVLPLHPRPGAPASRVLVRGIKGSRAPLTLLAGRPLHGETGRGFAPEFEAIFRGDSRLHW